MHKKGPGNERAEDYLSTFCRAQGKDSENFPWILKKSYPESKQKTWWTELFTATRESMRKLFELMTH